MAINENYTESVALAGRPALSVLHPIHEAAMRIADLGMNRSRHKTRDLVNLLLCHGARAWRSTQPSVKIHLHVNRSSQCNPIHLRLG
jgi:hypothetical protein